MAGINGEAIVKKLMLDLRELPVRGSGALITDGDGGNLSFRRQTIRLAANKKLELTLPPQSGFVMVIE